MILSLLLDYREWVVAAVLAVACTILGFSCWSLRLQRDAEVLKRQQIEQAATALAASQRASLALARVEVAQINLEAASKLKTAQESLPVSDSPEDLLAWLKKVKQ